MKRTKLFALPLVAFMTLGGCLGSMTGGELIRAGEPTGQINLINASRSTMTVVTISECSAISHGFTRLESGETVQPGRSRVFTVSQGCYDLQAGYGTSTGYTVWDTRLNVSAGRATTIRAN